MAPTATWEVPGRGPLSLEGAIDGFGYLMDRVGGARALNMRLVAGLRQLSGVAEEVDAIYDEGHFVECRVSSSPVLGFCFFDSWADNRL